MVDVFKSMFVSPIESIIKRTAANNRQFCCRIMPSLRSNSFGNLLETRKKLKAKSRSDAPVTGYRSLNECVRALARLAFFPIDCKTRSHSVSIFGKSEMLALHCGGVPKSFFEDIDKKLKLGYSILHAFLRKNFGYSLQRGFANSMPQGHKPPAFCLL